MLDSIVIYTKSTTTLTLPLATEQYLSRVRLRSNVMESITSFVVQAHRFDLSLP